MHQCVAGIKIGVTFDLVDMVGLVNLSTALHRVLISVSDVDCDSR